jgi:hypothetical protein
MLPTYVQTGRTSGGGYPSPNNRAGRLGVGARRRGAVSAPA